MAQSKEELLAKARERAAKNRAAKKEAVADQGAVEAPATPAADQAETGNDGPKDQVSEQKAEQKPKKEAKSDGKVVVTSPFRDKDDFNKTWNIGDDISHFPADRLQKIIELKLAEKK